MQIETMHQLYLDVLHDLYDAEHQVLRALPRMAKAADSEELQTGFEHHLDETQRHVERLDQVFEQLGETAKRRKCKAIEGLLEEGKKLIESVSDPEVLDVGLIAAAQKVEHYEIAAYGCAHTYAELLRQRRASDLLQQTLDEKKRTDEKLTELAVTEIDLEAAEAESATISSHAVNRKHVSVRVDKEEGTQRSSRGRHSD